MELTEYPTASLPNPPEPLQPGETAATKIWHYKHSNAARFGNVKACNSNFKYDYQIQEVLDWQQKNLNVTPTQLHRHNTKSNYWKMGVTLVPKHGAESSKNRALSKKPKGRRLLPNLLEPGQPRASKKRRKLWWYAQCDTCQRTYHWNCLTDLNACSHTARQDAENSEDWHCLVCTDLTQAEKVTIIIYAEEKEMIDVKPGSNKDSEGEPTSLNT